MAEEIIIRVFDIIGSPLCVSTDDGQIIHDKIAPLLREGKKASVSFAKVETIISTFLNAAIGQLYGEFTDEQIKTFLSVIDMEQSDLALLKRVVDNARIYFANREKFDQSWKQEIEEGDEGDEE